MSNRPNYILELKDGRTIEFVPHGQCDHTWVGSGRQFHVSMLEAIGATPVPQEESPVVYELWFGRADDEIPVPLPKLTFKSHEDAENYRRRCESIGPEWTDWEPKEEDQCWYIGQTCDIVTTGYIASVFGDDLLRGRLHPTKERAQEWLDRFGKAWGLK